MTARPTWHVQPFGDAAVLVEFSGRTALQANACVHRCARMLALASLEGVRDVVPGMRSLVVHIDPLHGHRNRLRAALERAADDAVSREDAAAADGPIVDVPVWYGGDRGPDLKAVAAQCGLSPDEVIARHSAPLYIVCFIGFLPGFPYLGLVDPGIRLPRLDVPRARVPSGSVAIAGEYTGVYPWNSPGGWHLLGSTDVALFDVGAASPARLRPGDRVRFVPRD